MKKLHFASIPFHIVLLITILVLGGCAPEKNTLNEKLKQYGYKFDNNGSLPLIEGSIYPVKEKTIHSMTAQGDDIRIEMEIIRPMTKEYAQKYTASKYEIIKDLYGTRVIPYSGYITTTTAAPEDKKPDELTIEVLGRPRKVLLANASERYVLGVWDDTLIKQKAAFCVIYDQKRSTYFQIIIFQPIAAFNKDKALDTLKSLTRI